MIRDHSLPGIHLVVKLHRLIRRQLRDAGGSVIGDVNAAIAMNVGEPAGSQTHVVSHSRVVQRTGGAEQPQPPAPPQQADDHDPKEDA